MAKRGKSHVVAGEGDPCPRCSLPMQIREHSAITAKHLRQPYYFTRWFYGSNPRCRAKEVMAERYKVHRSYAPTSSAPRLESMSKPNTIQDKRDVRNAPPRSYAPMPSYVMMDDKVLAGPFRNDADVSRYIEYYCRRHPDRLKRIRVAYGERRSPLGETLRCG